MIVYPDLVVARMSYQDKDRILANLIAMGFEDADDNGNVDITMPADVRIAEVLQDELLEIMGVDTEENNVPQYGLFNDESADYTEGEAVEADFWSREEAEAALSRYSSDDNLTVHVIEEPDDDDDGDDIEEDDDE